MRDHQVTENHIQIKLHHVHSPKGEVADVHVPVMRDHESTEDYYLILKQYHPRWSQWRGFIVCAREERLVVLLDNFSGTEIQQCLLGLVAKARHIVLTIACMHLNSGGTNTSVKQLQPTRLI